MSMQGHIAELKRRHQAADVELQEAINHPSTDDVVICALKRRKLNLKDQIERLSRSDSLH